MYFTKKMERDLEKVIDEHIKHNEKRVYVFNCADDFDFRGEEMNGNIQKCKDYAISNHDDYSLEEFQEAINDEELTTFNSFILID